MGTQHSRRGMLTYSSIKDSVGGLVRVWQMKHAKPPICEIRCFVRGSGNGSSDAQLTVGQAKRVIAGLQKFVAENE